MTNVRKDTTVRSALWAAYGDAMGFITELADQRILEQRLSAKVVTKLSPWTRRIGGRFGVDVNLPHGCYSDDTQLRLATSRAIGPNEFDIEAFSKVELPVWTSYALGAGRGTKLAAGSLAKKDGRWFSNFYADKDQNYVSSGGNGAAIRIQPHVWAAVSLDEPTGYLPDVLRNTLSTHGHPRAIAGAVFHALCTAHVMETNRSITPFDLHIFNGWTKEIPDLLLQDAYLRDFWIPKWEELSATSLQVAFNETFEEMQKEINKVQFWFEKRENSTYTELVHLLDLTDKSTRGSGSKTAIAAAALSMLLPTSKPNDLILAAVNHLGTDTDSIASMAGALIGALTDLLPPQKPQDAEYIEQDAIRLYSLSQGKTVSAFPYPGLIGWVPPRTTTSSVIFEKNKLFVAGLGSAEPKTETSTTGNSRGDNVYQWLKMNFGQIIFIKRQSDKALGIIHPLNLVESKTEVKEYLNIDESKKYKSNPVVTEQISLLQEDNSYDEIIEEKINIGELTDDAIYSGFNPSVIGAHIIKLANSSMGIENVIAYSSIIAKAVIVRTKRASNNIKK